MTYNYQTTDLLIYKAALRNDWNSVSEIFQQRPELTTKTISPRLETPLMIAVATNRSDDFVQKLCETLRRSDVESDGGTNRSNDFEEKRCEMLRSEVESDGSEVESDGGVYAKDIEGNTALHYAAKVGNVKAAKILIKDYPCMISVRNYIGKTAAILAASTGNMRVFSLCMNSTGAFRPLEGRGRTLRGDSTVATLTIQAGYLHETFDIALEYPDIILEECRNSEGGAFQVLATKIRENFLRRGLFGLAFYNVYDIKLKYELSILLVKHFCKIIIEKVEHDMAWKILGSTMATAVRYGNYELIEECILAYPNIIWCTFEGSNLFHSAIKQRQEKVYNLIYQMSGYKALVVSQLDDERQENVLHIAAKLAPRHRLNIITGAALQMQRELQWFEQVENLVEPSYKVALNKEGKNPRMVFTDEHEGLLREGQQWMKDTASSCTVVAALIVTIAFAAALTIPGGNKDDGKPLFLNKGSFMLFIISDAIALFSSSTSVLMFLGILTSRYAEEDFLYALPNIMTIGLVSLFMSLAATMITFSATLALVLQDKVPWIAAPLVIMTSIPVCLFAWLQFPLLMELVKSTYRPTIFYQQNDRMIH